MKRSGDLVIARDPTPPSQNRAWWGPRDRVIGNALSSCHPERGRVESCETSASRRTPVMSVPKHAASGSSQETWKDLIPRLTSAIQTFLAALREIFDESAYERFLLRTQRQRSVESYRIFMIERDAAAATRPRCC
jgi:hypothetical protein